MTKVGKSDWERTFAGTHGAPIILDPDAHFVTSG